MNSISSQLPVELAQAIKQSWAVNGQLRALISRATSQGQRPCNKRQSRELQLTHPPTMTQMHSQPIKVLLVDGCTARP